MEKIYKSFHYISFLSFPFLLAAIFFFYRPLFTQLQNMAADYNDGLFFMGIGLSFSSLADTNKKTKLGDRLYSKPKFAKSWIIYIFTMLVIIFLSGIWAQFITTNEKFQALSTGIFVFGLGVLGLLGMNLEIIRKYQNEWAKP
ncbi:hypothetical protein E1176_11695 [Fulvivirga sp. RKSG066]|uniref:hypothetical protein n=1 Tax=Fulvivirga aurantia TaxID=2529383 RepID=UPI0012BB5E7C|nr:hypothetical protein [Fulvivirga aurantia]MTI21685.1 hypothetical protein [Fulvivirga aurantia]